MKGSRYRDTRPELAVRRAAHALGLRYFVGRRPVLGLRRTADMLFPRHRIAVFIDGCFWHACPVHYVPPKSHSHYWLSKIDANVTRDSETNVLLTEAGWQVLRFWQHEPASLAAERIKEAISVGGGPT